MAAVFLLLLLVGGAHGVFYSPHVDEQQAMWDEYKIAFGKDYQNVAEGRRTPPHTHTYTCARARTRRPTHRPRH